MLRTFYSEDSHKRQRFSMRQERESQDRFDNAERFLPLRVA